jgi:hypothetical protein
MLKFGLWESPYPKELEFWILKSFGIQICGTSRSSLAAPDSYRISALVRAIAALERFFQAL